MLKNLCKKLVSCITQLFKTEKEQYKQKLIELQQKVQQSKIARSQLSIYQKQQQIPSGKGLFKQSSRNNISYGKQKSNVNNKLQRYKDAEQEISFNRQPKTKNKNIYSFKDRVKQNKSTPLQQSQENLQRNNIKQFPMPQIMHIQSNSSQQKQNRNSNNSQDSFHTLQSGSSSIHSISRRTFKSIKSSSSALNNSKLNRKKSFKINYEAERADLFKSLHNGEPYQPALEQIISQQQGAHIHSLTGNKISQILVEWNDRQYEHPPNFSPKNKRRILPTASNIISQITLQKLTSNHFLDEIINKLEDYYIFYYNQEALRNDRQKKQQKIQQNTNKSKLSVPSKPRKSVISNYSVEDGFYSNSTSSYKCSYHSQNYYDNANLGINTRMSDFFNPSNTINKQDHNTYMKVIQFYCDTTLPIKILQWYNSLAIRSQLFDFHRITLLENSVYPVMQIQQYSPFFPQKNYYTVIRQIEVGTFQNEYGGGTGESQTTGFGNTGHKKEENLLQIGTRYVLQLETTFDNYNYHHNTYGHISQLERKKQKDFRHLLRFQIAQKGLVQIYYESSENIGYNNHGQYLKEKWKNFENKLQSDKILKSYTAIYNDSPHKKQI